MVKTDNLAPKLHSPTPHKPADNAVAIFFTNHKDSYYGNRNN